MIKIGHDRTKYCWALCEVATSVYTSVAPCINLITHNKNELQKKETKVNSLQDGVLLIKSSKNTLMTFMAM